MTIQELLANDEFWRVQTNELGATFLDLVNGPNKAEEFRFYQNLFIQSLKGHIDWLDKGNPKFGTPDYWEMMKTVFYTEVEQQ